MYINSVSTIELINSLCQIFNVSDEKLYSDLSNIAYNSADDDMLQDNIVKYIKSNMVNKPNKILLFHLSRRLDNTDNDLTGYSLIHLLTSKNSYSDFLLKYNLSFKYNKEHIEIYHYNQKIKLNDNINNDIYLMRRLGYFNNIKDFCFNGFIINPLIGDNLYNSSLSLGSELVQSLSELINNKSMVDDYISNSTYYCLEYLVPIDLIIFDENPTLDNKSKITYMIKRYIDFFISYFVFQQREKTNTDIEIRLHDYDNLSSEYYIDKFKV